MLHPPTYTPVEQLDEEEGSIEKLLGQDSHPIIPLAHYKGSRVRNFWTRYHAYVTHGSLGVLAILFFCLWIHARTTVKVYNPMMRVYCEFLEDVCTYQDLTPSAMHSSCKHCRRIQQGTHKVQRNVRLAFGVSRSPVC